MHAEFLTQRDDIFVVRGFLPPDECEQYVARGEAAGFGDAPVNTLAGPQINKRMRNNDRVMVDDPSLAATMWDRLRPFVPARRGTGWAAVGLNERFRFYRYDPGQRFDWHFDGRYERSPVEQSALTFMIYLNAGFEGGATEFNFGLGSAARHDDPIVRVTPEAGMALVFVHAVFHQGAAVTRGRKYVLRSDVMYRWVGG